MQRMRIEPGALRAAMSRLASDGWLVRIREDRNSYYRLAKAGEAEFATATRRIYTTRKDDWNGRWTVVLAGHLKTKQKDDLRRDLAAAAFGTIGRDVFLRPEPARCVPASRTGKRGRVFRPGRKGFCHVGQAERRYRAPGPDTDGLER